MTISVMMIKMLLFVVMVNMTMVMNNVFVSIDVAVVVVVEEQDLLCKLIIVLVHYSTVANTAWMFVEGLFLHSRVAVSVFKKTMPYKLYFFIGWGQLAALQ